MAECRLQRFNFGCPNSDMALECLNGRFVDLPIYAGERATTRWELRHEFDNQYVAFDREKGDYCRESDVEFKRYLVAD